LKANSSKEREEEQEETIPKVAHKKATKDLNTELATVKSERDKFKKDYQTQVEYTNTLIQEHHLNVDTSKGQSSNSNDQVEETIDEEQTPLTPEQEAFQRIRQTGYKGNISMGEKVTKK
jgi:hypothetical protein